MELLFSNYLGDYSYSFQVVCRINLLYSYSFLVLYAECGYRKEFSSGIYKNFLELQLHNLMVFEFNM